MSTNPTGKVFELLSDILSSEEDMRNQRFQDPGIIKREDVERPYYFIRPYVTEYTEPGPVRRRKPIHLGFCDEITMAKAKALKSQIMAGINSGKFIAQSQVPFAGVLKRYDELIIPDLGPETQKTYRRHIRLHIAPFFGELRMFEITRVVVKTWLRAKEEAGLSHNSLIDLRKVLSAVFSQAKEWNLWDGENPCSKQKVGGRRAEKNKALPTAEGLQRFLAEIRDYHRGANQFKHWGDLIISADGARLIATIAVATGLRIGEVSGLRPAALNVAKEEIKISESYGRGHAKPTKNEDSERTVQAPTVVGMLAEYCRGMAVSEYIFGTKGNGGFPPDDRDLQQHVFRPAAERAGIYTKGFGMHRFRHLNISWRQEVGASPFEAQKSAGHSQASTTWLYTQTDSERERKHVEAIMDRLIVKDDGRVN